MRYSRALAVPVLLTALMVVSAQEKSVRPGINDSFKNPDLKKYLGTFEGESREIFTRREQILAACKIEPGLVVADVGAGTGLFTRLFASKVGPTGKVYAVDIAQRFLDYIDKTAKEAGLSNIKTIRCSQTSTELPANSVDLVFVCDTYHHFEFPQRTLASIHKALKPSGRLIVIDFHRIPGKSREWTLNHVRAGQEVFTREIVEAGFQLEGEEKELGLKENYFLRFKRVDSAKKTP
jgi:ubiquinone/menaquinone biosynthesis C-methylase UbiE